MRAFRSLVVVKHPVETVWSTVRDRLPELVPMIDDIELVAGLEREVLEPGRVRLVNEWRAKQRVPDLLKPALGADSFGWIDRNVWDDAERRCRWAIEPFVLPEHIRCAGHTIYKPAIGGKGTRVTFEGTFDLADGALASLAGALERPVSAFVESIVTILIPKNLRKLLEAAARLIDAGPRDVSADQRAMMKAEPRVGKRR